jgi:hypothetical protein
MKRWEYTMQIGNDTVWIDHKVNGKPYAQGFPNMYLWKLRYWLWNKKNNKRNKYIKPFRNDRDYL